MLFRIGVGAPMSDRIARDPSRMLGCPFLWPRFFCRETPLSFCLIFEPSLELFFDLPSLFCGLCFPRLDILYLLSRDLVSGIRSTEFLERCLAHLDLLQLRLELPLLFGGGC